MARQGVPILLRSRIGPGSVLCPEVDLSALKKPMVRLDPNVADFDDPNCRVTLKTRLSYDSGKTWPVEYTTSFVGGARTKNGGMPFKEYPAFLSTFEMVDGVEVETQHFFDKMEVTVVLNKDMAFGLSADAETRLAGIVGRRLPSEQ